MGSTHREKGDFSQAPGQEATAECFAPASRWLSILAAGLIVLSAIATYHNSFVAPFVYDDLKAIVENPTIRQLWPIWRALSPPRGGETVSGRPLLNFSLAINYAVGGLDVRGYHAANLLIHIAGALLLLGILRRTFLTPMLRTRFGAAATPLALAIAMLWTVHPLQTEAVTYVAQRAESLSGFFYLLTLYCVIRGAEGSVPLGSAGKGTAEKGTVPFSLRENRDSPQLWPQLWYAAAILACLLGMACKEVMVTAPLIVLLYDRTFLTGSFMEALRRRWGLYLGLAATWGLLAYLVLSTGLIARQPEMGAPDPWAYARSQPGVILHYLRLSVWPRPLCFDYAWPVASTLEEILPGAIVVGLLVAATVWGLMGRKAWGFLGAWFLLILAPTSSIMPLGQLAFEHRMYLSLAAVAVLAVAGGYALWDRLLPRPAGQGADQGGQSPFSPSVTHGKTVLWAAKKGTVPGRAMVVRWAAPLVVWMAVLLALGYATVIRNGDYRSALAIYQDTVGKRPYNPVAHNNLGFALVELGRTDEAIEHYREALWLKPDCAEAHNNLGTALVSLDKTDKAIAHFQEALRLKPDFAMAYSNLGLALVAVGKTNEAIQYYDQALRLKPDYADAHYNLGIALATVGRTGQAIEHYRQALRLKPDYVKAHNNLGNALVSLDRTTEGVEQYQEALRLQPDYADAYNNLGAALVRAGKNDEAIGHYNQALRLKPDYVEAHYNLGIALAALGMIGPAIEHYHEALRLRPDYAEAHDALGKTLSAVGRAGEAVEHYREVLRLKPDDAEARNNLGTALDSSGKNNEAIQQYHEALRLRPDYAEAHYNLGIALAAGGKTEEAIEHYRQAVRLKPDYFEAHNNLGNALSAAGRPNEAIEQYGETLRLKPDYAEAHYNLGSALAAVGRTDEAIAHFQRAVELKPNFAMARYRLAGVLASAGRGNESVEQYNQALQLLPDSIEVLNNLSWLLATREGAEGGDPARAVQLAQRARQLSPQENGQCLDTLAAAYAAAGRFADAVGTAERAMELAGSAGQTALAKNIQARLELYRAGRPYRQPPRWPEQTRP